MKGNEVGIYIPEGLRETAGNYKWGNRGKGKSNDNSVHKFGLIQTEFDKHDLV